MNVRNLNDYFLLAVGKSVSFYNIRKYIFQSFWGRNILLEKSTLPSP